MKIDPYKNEAKFLRWKESVSGGIPDLTPQNSRILLDYLSDMEMGLNVSKDSKKGARSYIRLNCLKVHLGFLMKSFTDRFKLDKITLINENQVHRFFLDMRSGKILTQDGRIYKSAADFVKDFKAFWHWHQKVSKKKGIEVQDITTDLDTKKDKPKWVYLTENQVRTLSNNAKYEYRVLIMFLYDTGIRSPTELINIRVGDFYNDFKELDIREEISKTFGRRIKLLLCSKLIKDYVKIKGLNTNDQVFPISPSGANRYLKRLAQKLLGDGVSEAGKKYTELSLYDFRHCSCCYWLPRYKSESALKFRFGWKKSDKIHYYSEMLGMRDTIQEEDLLVDITKTEIEKRLGKAEQEAEFLREDNQQMKIQMKRIMEFVIKLESQMGVLS